MNTVFKNSEIAVRSSDLAVFLSVKLKREDLTEDIVVIKINKLYKAGMSELELYEVTRGICTKNSNGY